MPPPPPPKTEDGATKSGTDEGTNYNDNDEEPQDDRDRAPPAYAPAGEKDEKIQKQLNGDEKIYRQFFMSLAILFIVTMYLISDWINGVYENQLILDEYGLSGDLEDSYEHILTYNQLFVCSLIFVSAALSLNMYYYVFLRGDSGAGSLAVLTEFLNCRAPTKQILYWVIAGLYGLGILLYYAGFLSYMAYFFDEDDYSPFYVDEDDADDDTLELLFGLKTFYWANFFAYPLYCAILCSQHLFPQFTLQAFEVRVCLWSIVVFLTMFIYAIFLSNEDFYKDLFVDSTTDDVEDIDESNFVWLRIIVWLTMLVWLGLVIYSAMATIKVVLQKQDSDVSNSSVFKIYVLIAVILFIFMFIIAILASVCNIYLAILWVGTTMVLTDILL